MDDFTNMFMYDNHFYFCFIIILDNLTIYKHEFKSNATVQLNSCKLRT